MFIFNSTCLPNAIIIYLVAALIGCMLSVWMIPVFAYCFWVGKIFTERSKGHWMTFLFLPMAFLMTAFFSLLARDNTFCGSVYLMSLCTGCSIGLLITNRAPVKVDLVLQRISAPGSWLTMVCLMSLCVSKCVMDWLSVSMSEYIFQLQVINFGVKGFMTGLLFGQALSLLYRFLVASKCSPDELIRGRFARFYGLKQILSPSSRKF